MIICHGLSCRVTGWHRSPTCATNPATQRFKADDTLVLCDSSFDGSGATYEEREIKTNFPVVRSLISKDIHVPHVQRFVLQPLGRWVLRL